MARCAKLGDFTSLVLCELSIKWSQGRPFRRRARKRRQWQLREAPDRIGSLCQVGQSPGRSPETEPVAAAALDTQGVQEPVTKPSGPNQASQAPAKPAEPPGTSTKKPAKKCCPF